MQFNLKYYAFLSIVMLIIAIQKLPKPNHPAFTLKSRFNRSPHSIPTLCTTSPATSVTIRLKIPRTQVNRTAITLPLVSKVERAPALVLFDGRMDREGPVVQHVAFEIARLRSGAVAAIGINPGFFVAVGVEFHVEVVADV